MNHLCWKPFTLNAPVIVSRRKSNFLTMKVIGMMGNLLARVWRQHYLSLFYFVSRRCCFSSALSCCLLMCLRTLSKLFLLFFLGGVSVCLEALLTCNTRKIYLVSVMLGQANTLNSCFYAELSLLSSFRHRSPPSIRRDLSNPKWKCDASLFVYWHLIWFAAAQAPDFYKHGHIPWYGREYTQDKERRYDPTRITLEDYQPRPPTLEQLENPLSRWKRTKQLVSGKKRKENRPM